MELHEGGREYAYFAWEGVPETVTAAPAIRVHGLPQAVMQWWTGTGRTWDKALAELHVKQAEVDSGAVRIARVLLAHESAPIGDAVAALATGRQTGDVVLDTGTEIIIRPWTDAIYVD